ncbi:DUF3099 domain-containing protein [Pseudoclavibacter alba]|uniref:DUF3099 domain-containing protein n=1 Tax=Pseudoclavibacter albus TaxID=272241 RepID=A0ABT2HUQ0_9MICO|nr:DUF3099 domain-containing protein [Pseudoclavibacter alba]MCT2042042.1 DUF3099 domain-containing protein [Pseudoclavibacter alba]
MKFRRGSEAANITSMPETAHEERVRRMRNYAITMAVRTACFLALIWVRGPWMLVFAAGAIFLPYFAVVVANAVARNRRRPTVQRPSTIVLVGSPTPHEQAQEAA